MSTSAAEGFGAFEFMIGSGRAARSQIQSNLAKASVQHQLLAAHHAACTLRGLVVVVVAVVVVVEGRNGHRRPPIRPDLRRW